MKPEVEHKKFREQYTNEDWSRLKNRVQFMEAFHTDDFVRMGELADRITEGEAKTMPDARLKKRLNQLPY